MTAPRKFLYIGFFSFIVIGMPGAALGVAWVYMQTTFGVSLESLGILLTALTAGRLVLSVYSGRIINWIGLGNYLLVGCIVATLSLTGYILVPTWPLLILMGLIYGSAVSVINAAVNTFAAAHYGSGKMNWLHASYGVGSALGPLSITFAVTTLGMTWQWGYLLFIAVQGILLVLVLLTRAAWTLDNADAMKSSQAPAAPLRASLRLTVVWFGIVLFVLHGGIQAGTGQLAPTLLTASRGIDVATAGMWVSIYWAGLTAGRVLSGLIVERIGNDRFMRLNMFVTVISTLMIWANIHHLLTFLGIALTGFTLGPVLPVLLADTPRRTGLSHTANAIGLLFAGAGIGVAVLPGMAAFVAERAGLETIGAYLVLIAVLSFVVHEGLLLYGKHKRGPVLRQAVVGD